LWDGMGLLADRRFELTGSVPEGVLNGDPDRLAQALRNLIGNAIEHTAPGVGIVRLRVETVHGGRLRLLVEDDGPGIPKEQRERVFDRFHRIDSARDRGSSEGGARIELVLPGFVPSAPPGAAKRAYPTGPLPLTQDAGVPERVAARLGPDQ
jgi:two-component system OmpR family sensor kinase